MKTKATNKPDANTCPELEPYKLAAYKLCEKRGVNPEEFKDVPHATLHGATVRVFRWQAAAEELIDLSAMLVSLREATEEISGQKVN